MRDGGLIDHSDIVSEINDIDHSPLKPPRVTRLRTRATDPRLAAYRWSSITSIAPFPTLLHLSFNHESIVFSRVHDTLQALYRSVNLSVPNNVRMFGVCYSFPPASVK